MLKRREVEASQQDGLLREFNSAKEGSWREERQQRQTTLMQQGNVNVILGLCIIIIALLLILALVIAILNI